MRAFIHHVDDEQSFTDPFVLGGETEFTVAELTLPPGAWVVHAKGELWNLAPQSAKMVCRLGMSSIVPVTHDFSESFLGVNEAQPFALCIGVVLSAQDNVQLACLNRGFPFKVKNITLSATEVDSVFVSLEQGTELALGSSPAA